MKISAKTDVGIVRSNNQDAYACGEFSPTAAYLVVCDGMGGASAGDVASTTAAKMISEKVVASYNERMAGKSVNNLFECAITTANACLYSMAMEDNSLYGMGTTVVTAVVANNKVYVAHAGDSRAYIYSKETGLKQITTDHSIVQEMVDRGEITEEEAKVHPRKNIITRALGVGNDIEIDFYDQDFSEDSILLVCTDGLTNFVDDKIIEKLLAQEPFEGIADRLVNLANENGGGDNITAVVISN